MRLEREELERRAQELEERRARLDRREGELSDFVAQVQGGLQGPAPPPQGF
jgi:hypothetical protein